MSFLDLILPGGLLIYKFILKIALGKSLSTPDIINAIIALPVDIIFLSSSLLAGYISSSPSNTEIAIQIFILYLVIALIIILMWRLSDHMFTKDRLRMAYAITALCYLLSLGSVYYTMQIISINSNTQPPTQSNTTFH